MIKWSSWLSTSVNCSWYARTWKYIFLTTSNRVKEPSCLALFRIMKYLTQANTTLSLFTVTEKWEQREKNDGDRRYKMTPGNCSERIMDNIPWWFLRKKNGLFQFLHKKSVSPWRFLTKKNGLFQILHKKTESTPSRSQCEDHYHNNSHLYISVTTLPTIQLFESSLNEVNIRQPSSGRFHYPPTHR